MRMKAVVSSTILIVAGMTLLVLASAHLQTSPRLTQIGHEENLGASNSYTVFLEQGQECRVDIAADATEVGRSYDITVTQVEETLTLYEEKGPIGEQTILQMFPAQTTGHYEVDWHDLNVTQITAYRVDELGQDLIPRYPLSVAGMSAVMAAIACFLALERNELFQGRKTRLFWYGLVIFAIALVPLFGLLWSEFVLEASLYIPFLFFGPAIGTGPLIFGSLVFLSIGLYMMKNGAKRES